MREIVVEPYPIEPVFKSAQEAISHAMSYGPLIKAKSDYQQVAGSQVVDACWNDTEFLIRFSNDRFLHVFLGAGEHQQNVEWRILENEPPMPEVHFARVGDPAVVLLFPPGGRYIMDRSSLVAARRGSEVKGFFVNEMGFYVYTAKQRILVFHAVRQVGTEKTLLYVDEED